MAKEALLFVQVLGSTMPGPCLQPEKPLSSQDFGQPLQVTPSSGSQTGLDAKTRMHKTRTSKTRTYKTRTSIKPYAQKPIYL